MRLQITPKGEGHYTKVRQKIEGGIGGIGSAVDIEGVPGLQAGQSLHVCD
jgi:hypothetical protein